MSRKKSKAQKTPPQKPVGRDLTLRLSPAEHDALAREAQENCRTVAQQALWRMRQQAKAAAEAPKPEPEEPT